LYPTRLRATGAGSAYSLSRLATAFMPFVLLPLLDAHGSGAVFVCIRAAMVLLSIDVAVLGPRTTGRSLEDVAGADASSVPLIKV
jgi:putative MFS transporter